MKKGKIIVIEGVDSSGKETQAKMLVENLNKAGHPTEFMSFPRYERASGKIIGGPYLGKPDISKSWFPETSSELDPKATSLYYAADRRFALTEIHEIISSGKNLVLDRYVSANMGHQGGKIKDSEERKKLYTFLDQLEHDLLEMPRPDIILFLYVPHSIVTELLMKRDEAPDRHEKDLGHLKDTEDAYLELVNMYDWHKVDCTEFFNLDNPKESINKVNDKIYERVMQFLSESGQNNL